MRHFYRRALVLCIDDDRTALCIRQMVLERAGYQVLTALNESQALDLFLAHPVDLVITDHLLYEHTSRQLVRRMKELKSDVPIMLFSGVTELPDLRDVDMFVSKLEPTEEVLRKIASLVDRGLDLDLQQKAA